ncbi:(-)-alpha-terpineol synthase-like isoform X3 [Quillaja saponaria]|uniref:(-)-alpha-terpineol synthase-like isoform X3 n=1 Tax=Quillaja saponaria TaxID=32244 RepID=A0AAD7L252_QUISA|nr:(-)-alpha-terpineol synthase-like isoform X3 [Quillaja saponaria]
MQEESYSKQHNMLLEEVRMILRKVANPLHQLELIDMLQRLELSYRFKDEIKRILDNVYDNSNGGKDTQIEDNNLYSTSLEFRLLRQYGYHVSAEVFSSFQNLCNTEDIDGMLSLYEASYLLVESETILDEARDFTSKHLKEFVSENKDGDNITSALLSHALEFPLHWRIQRLKARWFIGVYERFHNMNPILLELAKLDFNMVQATHQKDLKQASSWWKKSGLGEKLSFARDSGYTPTLQEYSDNAWVSISAPVILVYAYFLVSNSITNEALDCLENNPDIIRLSAMTLRLADDLGTSSWELDTCAVAKSIQCYMKETNGSEEDAREHVMSLIHTTLKKMNRELASSSPFCEAFRQVAVNLGRMALCMYQHGDGHTVQDPVTKDRILSLLIHPIPLAH